ncbi:MAG: IS256 family transposase, partial [Flavobacteriales bacterium]|nr:IS256 family transposase [Flavobacteriales bacterium]
NENSPKSKNSRNGKSSKTIISDDNESVQIDIPRDRNAEFEPAIIKKHERRSNSFNDMIISLYSRGLSTSEIKEHIEDQYGTEVSKELVSHITNTVHEEVKAFRNRPLENLYPILFFDAIRVKIRDSGRVINKAVYLALGVNLEGQKELLGMWIEENEGAKFWLNVMTELKNRGLNDIFIACIDGLKGFPDAINTVFPETEIQLCIVHQVRNSLKFVSWKDRKEVANDLKEIYRAPTEEIGLEALENFETKWNEQYPVISKSWRSNWENLQTFFKFPAEIRKVIYTTNAIESVNMSLRKVTKTRASFPNDDALYKMFYLALKNISKRWTMPIQNWNLAMNRFSIIYENRLSEFTQNYL